MPSIDKGANQPNVFCDPKSSESAFPYYSHGTRDDLIQRRGLEAVLGYWRTGGGHNPVSSVYSGRMIGTAAVWTWDARPYPAWPARTDAWSDGDLWPYGHWLTGKIGLADLSALVAKRCARVGFADVDLSGLTGVVVGYVRDRPMSPRAELEMLMQASPSVSTSISTVSAMPRPAPISGLMVPIGFGRSMAPALFWSRSAPRRPASTLRCPMRVAPS